MLKAVNDVAMATSELETSELKEEVFLSLDTSEISVDSTRFVVDIGMLASLPLRQLEVLDCKLLLFFSSELLFS